MLLGLVALGLLCAIGTAAADNTTSTQGMQYVNNIQPYNGPIGADSSLYGLKIAFENLDEAFTFNQSERLEKEIDHSDLRLAELESALAANRTDAANQALDQYWQKLNQTESTLDLFNGTGSPPMFNGTYNRTYNRTGSMPAPNGNEPMPTPIDPSLTYAQEMILNHQAILQNFLLSHPDIPGLARAYDTSRDLEQKFELKTQTRFERVQDADNRIWLRAEHLSSGTRGNSQTTITPVYTGRQPGPTGNRIAPAAGYQSWEQTGQTWNRTEQIPRETNQSLQDQHRPVIQENRNENGNGTGYRIDNNNSYRNDNRDTRFYNR
jgi:hypothetical protein